MSPRPTNYRELRCRGCLWCQVCGPGEMAGWLREVGKLRAGRVPEDLGVLYELFRAAAPQFVCPKCGKIGLAVTTAVEDEQWPGPVLCVACSKPIPPERLEAVPGTKVCTACQHASDSGRPKQHKDFCPRCGAPLEVRVVHVGRSTRYVMACSGTPPCL